MRINDNEDGKIFVKNLRQEICVSGFIDHNLLYKNRKISQ